MKDLFNGGVAIVTGGASGIGRALATALAERGATVAIADISLDDAKDAAAAIGQGAHAYHCDVTDIVSVAALADAVTRDFGGVHFVFANAGVLVMGSLHETDPKEFQWVFDVNVRGTFNTVHAFLPLLLAQAAQGRSAKFVITGSENSVGLPFQGVMTAYTATKHALLAMADGLRRDMEDKGVDVAIVCPGAVNTRLWDARRARQENYGGNAPILGDEAAQWAKAFGNMVHPSVTARICLDGVEEGEFVIITDHKIRAIAEKRHGEVAAALDRLDARLKDSAS